MNRVGLDAVPTPVVTWIVPLEAPGGTVTLTDLGESDVIGATVVPIITTVASARFTPLMVITLPTFPDAGLNVVMVGGGSTYRVDFAPEDKNAASPP